jgi:uncharacterized membrane protein YccC
MRSRLFKLARYFREEDAAFRSALLETAESVRQRRFANSSIPYSIRLAATIGISTEIYRRLDFPSGYWIPMTAMFVLNSNKLAAHSKVVRMMVSNVGQKVEEKYPQTGQ